MQHRSRHVLDIDRINRSSRPQRGAEEAAQNAALARDEAWFGDAGFNSLVFSGKFVDCSCCFALCRLVNRRWGIGLRTLTRILEYSTIDAGIHILVSLLCGFAGSAAAAPLMYKKRNGLGGLGLASRIAFRPAIVQS
jgi:hypothetical protein